jgi:hypothetical protein
MRLVLAQLCIDAVQVMDGREIWLIRGKPALTRWYNNTKMGIYDAGLN